MHYHKKFCIFCFLKLTAVACSYIFCMLFQSCLCHLNFQVLNAIDAGATSIAVRVNFKFHKIQVVDNGCGLISRDLDLIGTR
jgi:hypothetical protein